MARSKRNELVASIVVVGALIGTPVLAGVQTWTYTTDNTGVWSTPANWNSGAGPAPATNGTDNVEFGPNGTAATVTSTVDSSWAANGTVGSMTFNAGGTKGYVLNTGAGATLNIAGGITNLNTQSQKLNGALNFTASQTLNLKNGASFTDSGTWTSAPGTVLTIAGTGSKQFQFYGGSTPAGFQGSVQQAGSVILNFQATSQYSRMGTNTFYVNSLDAANGNVYGTPQLIFAPTSSGTFANDISFSNFNAGTSGNYQIKGTPGGSPVTITLSGDWSGDIGAGSDYQGYSGIRFSSGSQVANTNLRFLLTGDNSGLTSSTANMSTGRFPVQVSRGLLVVDNANALGSSNSLLVGVGSGNANNANTAGLLAADTRTINSDILVYKNANGSAVSQATILGVDGSSSSATFAGGIYLEGSNTLAQVPTLQLTAPTTSVATFNGNIQDRVLALAYTVPVSITGGGIVSLNGTNTYSGPTTVTPGTTLGGIGSLTSALTVNGILAPGNSIGTLTVGNTTFGTGGSFDVELGAGLSDLLDVNGNLDIANAILNLSGIADNVTSYVITTYTGSLTGPFSNVTGLPAGYTLDYGSGSAGQITLLVPEPASLALIGLGSVLVFARRRR